MVVMREGGRVIGCAGWERHGAATLMRSVAVRADARGRGLGQALVRAALARIANEGAGNVVLLTNDAEQFFATLGFTRIERAELPDAVAAGRLATAAGCSNAVAMRLEFP
jgi:N-acetylglutamate synthase-like GNAT family acetyltransferase